MMEHLLVCCLLLLCIVVVTSGASQSAGSSEVHVFYYLWYGNPETDGQWLHWNHRQLPHWDASKRDNFPQGQYTPPEELGSAYYPTRGPYSSSSRPTIRQHMEDLKLMDVTTASLSWWGRPSLPGTTDGEGVSTDQIVPLIFLEAEIAGVSLSIHLEPYQDRTALSVRDDIGYLLQLYGSSPALHRDATGRPLVFVYDAYHTPPHEWAEILHPQGAQTIRGTPLDCRMISLLLEKRDLQTVVDGGWDGFYTYFAATGFTGGSQTSNWRDFVSWGDANGKEVHLSVGPGYNDTKIRPWNGVSTRARRGGSYYSEMWQSAIAAGAKYVSITSYNEWGEGTQIEPASPWSDPASPAAEDYSGSEWEPSLYLKETAKFGQELRRSRQSKTESTERTESRPESTNRDEL